MSLKNDKKTLSLERIGLSPSAKTTVLAAFVGVLGGFGALGFKHLIGAVTWMFWQQHDLNPTDIFSHAWFYRFGIPVIGGLIVGPLIYFFAREAKGHGVPEVMAAVVTRNSIIRPVVVLVKALASAISIGSGGSVGREGPIVQIGAAIASTTGQVFRLRPAQMKTIVGCGVAAGIGATFNAPIAGTLFALELIVSDFGLTSFTPIIVAAVTSTAITRHFEGNTLAFYLPHFQMVSVWELFIYLILGLFAGVVGYMFSRFLYVCDDFFSNSRIPEWFRPAVGGMIIGLIALKFPHIMGVGYETIAGIFEGQYSLILILFLVFLKLFATSVTVGSGGSGGVFAPSLFMGAMLGGAFGMLVNMLFPTLTGAVGAYALVGMAAVNGACTLAPLSAIIILVELTDNYSIILPLMLTVVVSTFVARRISHESIYTRKLSRRGISMHMGEDVNILKSVAVHDIVRHDEAVIDTGKEFEDLMNLALTKHRNVIFTVDENNKYVGLITLLHLKYALSDPTKYGQHKSIDDFIELSPSVNYNDTLDTVLTVFGEYGYDRLPVVNDKNEICGSVVLGDVVAQYNREVSNRNIAIELGAVIHSADQSDRLKLSGEVVVTEIPVPKWMDGKTIEEIGIRKKYGVSIFLVNEVYERKEPVMVTPSAKYVLKDGNILLVSGSEKDIDRVVRGQENA